MLNHDFIDRNGPALILIHGLGSDRHCFDAAAKALPIADWSLLLPDLPGFGESDAKNGSYSLEEAADHIIQLCKHYRIQSCAVIGHSMGGAVGTLVAERFNVTHFVNAVGNLVSEDTLFSRKIARQNFSTFSQIGFQAYKDEVNKNLRKDRPTSSYPLALEKTSARAMYLSAQKLVELSDHGDLLERFIKLKAKKMYLQDEDNPIADRLALRLDKARIVRQIVPNTGHALMEDNPHDFYQIVGEFLNG